MKTNKALTIAKNPALYRTEHRQEATEQIEACLRLGLNNLLAGQHDQLIKLARAHQRLQTFEADYTAKTLAAQDLWRKGNILP